MPYSISALSRQGESQVKNSDNIYMNGVYMDSFTFSRYEKEQEIAGGASLLVLCAGYDDQSIARRFLNRVNKAVKKLSSDTDAAELMDTVTQCVKDIDSSASEKKKLLDVGILITHGIECSAACFGEVTVTVDEGESIYSLCSGTEDGAVGLGNTADEQVMSEPKSFATGARILMHTVSVTDAMHAEDIQSAMRKPTASACIGILDKKLQDVKTPISMICIDIAPEALDDENDKRFAINNIKKTNSPSAAAIACAVLVAVALIATAVGVIVASRPSKPELEGGVSIQVLKEQGSWNKTKASLADNHGNMTAAKTWVEGVETAILNRHYKNVAYTDEMVAVTDNIATFNDKYRIYIDLYNKLDTLEGEDRKTVVTSASDATAAYNSLVEAVPKLNEAKNTKDEADKKAAEAKAKAAAEAKKKENKKNKATQRPYPVKTQQPDKTKEPAIPQPATPKPKTLRPMMPAFESVNKN